MKPLFTVPVLMLLVAGCATTPERTLDSDRKAALSARMAEINASEEIARRLHTYKTGETTWTQFLADSGLANIEVDLASVGDKGIVTSTGWKVYSIQLNTSDGALTSKYVVGHAGGILATLHFEKGVLSFIRFN
ncbi:MAG: hypothetical protein AB1705_17270 [Verrucomicrobiota bacterium]